MLNVYFEGKLLFSLYLLVILLFGHQLHVWMGRT